MSKYETRNMVLLNTKKPWVRPHLALVEIHIGPKQIYGKWRDRRFVYGVSMFGTEEAALRGCYRRVEEFVADWYNQKFFYDAVQMCKARLAQRRSA